jgi:hypothetical protein
MISDEMEHTRALKHQRVPWKSIPNPNGIGSIAVYPDPTAQAANAPNGGYYSSLASEYRQIAKDVENQALYEMDSLEGKEGKEGKEAKEYKEYKKMKERLKETYKERQALVPNATVLYG